MPTTLSIPHAIILGLVEGITEYLPVSSTGHLILASWLVRKEPLQQSPALKEYLVVIQAGAILAVAFAYWPTILRMLKGLIGKDTPGFRLAMNLLVAFFPAAIAGLLLDDVITEHLMNPVTVTIALGVGGVFMLLLHRWMKQRARSQGTSSEESDAASDICSVTMRQALIVGFLQLFALIPGTSRSMMTITGGLLAGLRPRQSAQFSFLLGMITLTAAAGYALFKDFWNIHKHAGNDWHQLQILSLGGAPVVIGILVAGVSAFLAVKWFVAVLLKVGLAPFGIYRIALSITLVVLFTTGVLKM